MFFIHINSFTHLVSQICPTIEKYIDTRRYGPLRGPTSSSCGGLRPSAEAFFALRAKKKLTFAVLAHFWHFLVSSSNLGNF